MANEIRSIARGALTRTSRSSSKARAMAPNGPTGGAPGQVSDGVSLSRLYHAIRSSEGAIRLQSLELQVAQRAYRVPPLEVSRCIVADLLRAA